MSRPDLNVLCWEGYDYPALLEPFGREHGVDVRGEAHVTDAGAVARVIGGEAGRWDIVNLNNPFVRDVLHPQGLIRELGPRTIQPSCRRLAAAIFRSLSMGAERQWRCINRYLSALRSL